MIDIKAYEAMAKLSLPDDERGQVSLMANELLESFAAIDKIDTTGVEPLISPLNIQNVLREDISSKVISREELLSCAPERNDGYFQVPKTID